MASPTILTLPQELRDQIYDHVLQQQRPLAQPWSMSPFTSNVKLAAFGERPVAWLVPGQDGAEYQILSNIELAQSCRRIRFEMQSYLRIAVVDTIVKVQGFAYDHAISFLQSLPPTALYCFTVQPERNADNFRKLRIELSGPFDQIWTFNLTCWLSAIDSLLGAKDELATAYKIVPNDQYDDKWHRAPLWLVAALYQMHKSQRSGPVKEELFKIMLTFWGRYRVEKALKNGDPYTMGNRDQLESVEVQWEA